MPVENLATGAKLVEDEAPLASEIENWLLANPGYVVFVIW